MRKANPLLCPACKGILQRVGRYNEDESKFLGNDIKCSGCGLVAFEETNEAGWRKVHRIRTRRYLDFMTRGQRFQDQIETQMSKLLKTQVTSYPLSAISLARLFNLRIILLRHKISVNELCQMMLKVRGARGEGTFMQRLNMSLSQIGGPDFLHKLELAVAKRYPRHENIRAWQSDEQNAQVMTLIGDSDNLDYAEKQKRLSSLRSILLRQAKLRNYRDNPWGT